LETSLPIPQYAHSGIDWATRDDEQSPAPAARWLISALIIISGLYNLVCADIETSVAHA
jgi:hypothetical protein